jgi:hypothetical protein
MVGDAYDYTSGNLLVLLDGMCSSGCSLAILVGSYGSPEKPDLSGKIPDAKVGTAVL